MSVLARLSRFLILAGLVWTCLSGAAFARDAAFLNPGAAGGMSGAGEEAIKVDPKAEIDVGETALNIAKRATIFFVNQTSMPVKIEKIAISSDSSVAADETANDCKKQGSIAPLSRCSVEVSVTPTGSGSWSVDVLMTHNGAGRITRARLNGRTTGTNASDNKNTGLDISPKEIKPIDFGTVDVGDGKIVRSTLMINNSVDPITIYAIDVIEADNGLQRLKQGCSVDMELAPGASCPVTLMWEPKETSQISTDLIIRHSGKLGFAVIPVRGISKGEGSSGGGKSGETVRLLPKSSVPMPLSAHDIEKEVAGSIAPIQVPSASISGGGSMSGAGKSSKSSDGKLSLIGTIGDRALFLLPDGSTATLSIGDSFETKDGISKLIFVGAKSADILTKGKKTTISLEAASSLVSPAIEQYRQSGSSQSSQSSSGKSAPSFGNDQK